MARKIPRIVRHPQAVLDIVEVADFIASRTSIEAGERFVFAAEKTMDLLSRMPRLGTRWESDHPCLADLRFFPVTRFPNHLIFYRPLEDGLELVRVLHGAREIASLLESEEETTGS